MVGKTHPGSDRKRRSEADAVASGLLDAVLVGEYGASLCGGIGPGLDLYERVV